MAEKILEVKDLSVSFSTYAGEAKAVRNVSFDLYQGEMLAIVGESGSGKSVTAKTIMGLLPQNASINQGSILYKGEDLAAFKEKDFRRIRGKEISMVFQDPFSSLNPIARVGDQIMEAVLQSGNIGKKEAEERALQLMEIVGIRDPKSRFRQYPFQFSGGMRQRIVIAIAMASSPKILICDEPTTALDVTMQAKILKQIDKIKREQNLSSIFITHDLGVVARIADRVCIMYAGKVVEYGTVEDIFYRPAHPYTWCLLSAVPDLNTTGRLYAIPGAPPNILNLGKGDAFAPRNKYALNIDFEEEPPFFQISDTHYAATWLLHENAPHLEMPEELRKRIQKEMEEQ